ncbi:hypothetical protein ABTM42_20875, partial [Acinetobacter baumannii]
MIYVLWALPILAVAGLVASRRLSTVHAGACGLVSAVVVALLCAPGAFGPWQAVRAVTLGAWLGLLV